MQSIVSSCRGEKEKTSTLGEQVNGWRNGAASEPQGDEREREKVCTEKKTQKIIVSVDIEMQKYISLERRGEKRATGRARARERENNLYARWGGVEERETDRWGDEANAADQVKMPHHAEWEAASVALERWKRPRQTNNNNCINFICYSLWLWVDLIEVSLHMGAGRRWRKRRRRGEERGKREGKEGEKKQTRREETQGSPIFFSSNNTWALGIHVSRVTAVTQAGYWRMQI